MGPDKVTSPERGLYRRINDKISCRAVLNIMVILGFMVNYMLRLNLTIAIVDMVIDSNSTSEEANLTMSHSTNFSATDEVVEESSGKFYWNTYEKNFILGSFFWGYICTELPGGRMSEVFGARRVFGYSILLASIVTLATPITAYFGYIPMAILRIIIGFFLGVTFPAMQPIASKWIPPADRTKFVSNMMASSLGGALTLPMCGFLLATFGWESVFYVTGGLGTLWGVLWFLLVFDTPGQHPRITREEREFIEKAIGHTATSKKVPKVPWKRMLTSAPVWAIVVTHGSSVFCYFTVLNQLPTYMKNILNFNIKENGILSSFPYFGKYFMALVTSIIADCIRGNGKISTTATRKLFTTFAVGLPGLLMVLQVFMGESATWSVTIFTLALTLNGAVTAGYLGNGLDIAPNFSGTIFGMANTLSSLGGYLSTYLVAYLTSKNEKSYEAWQTVFWVLAAAYVVGSLTYLMFGTGELQEWNSPEGQRSAAKDVEMAEKEALAQNNQTA